MVATRDIGRPNAGSNSLATRFNPARACPTVSANCAPAGVGLIPRGPRSNSRVPAIRSSLASANDMAGCVRLLERAAAVTAPVRMAAQNASRWRRLSFSAAIVRRCIQLIAHSDRVDLRSGGKGWIREGMGSDANTLLDRCIVLADRRLIRCVLAPPHSDSRSTIPSSTSCMCR